MTYAAVVLPVVVPGLSACHTSPGGIGGSPPARASTVGREELLHSSPATLFACTCVSILFIGGISRRDSHDQNVILLGSEFCIGSLD